MNPTPVEWNDQAERELAHVWLYTPDRKAVTQAQAMIDALLSADPYNNSLLISEGLRRIIVLPLKVFFQIRDEDGVVEVSDVDHIPPLVP